MKNTLGMFLPVVLTLVGFWGLTAVYAAPGVLECGALCTKTVVDSTGQTVRIPSVVQRIVITCYGGAAHEVSVFGGADKIVAHPTNHTFRQFQKMYPVLDGISDAGSFDNVNLEKILTLRPDMVIAGVVSPQGNEKIESLGIPVFTVAVGRAEIASLLKEFETMGTVLGAENKAAELVSYWRQKLTLIAERVTAVPAAKRKKVFYTSHGSSSPLYTGGRRSWSHHFITASGGVNVAESLGFFQELTVEQLLLWNPDVIVVSNMGAVQSPADAVLKNPKLKHIKAIKEGAVYPCPIGAFWWDRPSPEAILGILWLSQTLYPEILADVDLKHEAHFFYHTFYGYELTDAELETFF